jgi:hypothetical protein
MNPRYLGHALLLALVLAVALGLLPVPVSGHTLPAGRVVNVAYYKRGTMRRVLETRIRRGELPASVRRVALHVSSPLGTLGTRWLVCGRVCVVAVQVDVSRAEDRAQQARRGIGLEVAAEMYPALGCSVRMAPRECRVWVRRVP